MKFTVFKALHTALKVVVMPVLMYTALGSCFLSSVALN